MRLAPALALAAALMLALAAFLRNAGVLTWDRGTRFKHLRLRKGREVRLSDLPRIVKAMSIATATVRYAGLTFDTPDRPDIDAVNLNLSFENGVVGFDWVLIADGNRKDEAAFRAFASAKGVTPVERSMNGVSYLRVECDDVPGFTASIVTEMYRRPGDPVLGLFHEGFEWPPARAAKQMNP